jgi:hypothetical protein
VVVVSPPAVVEQYVMAFLPHSLFFVFGICASQARAPFVPLEVFLASN